MTDRFRKPRLRRILRTIHLWLGVSLGIPLALIGVSGSILVFEHEIAALFEAAPERTLAQGEIQPASAIVEAARARAPAGTVPALLALPDAAGEPATVRFTQPGRAAGPGAAVTVQVDPVSLATFERPEPSAVQRGLREIFQFHANLSAGREGRIWVGWLGVVMCFFGVSGLIMWWPRPSRWKQAFGVTKGAQGIRLNRELHGAAGFWGLVVFMMISFSGVYIVFPETAGELVRTVLPGRDLRAEVASLRVQPLAGGPQLDVDRVVSLARSHADDVDLRMVAFPIRPEQPYRVAFKMPGRTVGHGVPMIAVFVDPWAAEVIATHDPRAFTLGESVSVWQRALHGGYGLGWVWKILTFLSGLLPVLFAITGISMWWLRRRKKARAATVARRRSAAPAE